MVDVSHYIVYLNWGESFQKVWVMKINSALALQQIIGKLYNNSRKTSLRAFFFFRHLKLSRRKPLVFMLCLWGHFSVKVSVLFYSFISSKAPPSSSLTFENCI